MSPRRTPRQRQPRHSDTEGDCNAGFASTDLVALAFSGDLALSSCFVYEMAVHQLLGELDALVLDELRVLLETAVERHADLPRPRVQLRILDGRFVAASRRGRRRVPLDDMQRSLWKLPARSNQLSPLKAVTSTTSVSPSHRPRDQPIQRVDRALGGRVHADDAAGARELVGDQDVVRRAAPGRSETDTACRSRAARRGGST